MPNDVIVYLSPDGKSSIVAGDFFVSNGICSDRDGAIRVAGTRSGALRVSEGGKIDYQVTTKRPVFAVMLGGAEQRQLFMCTSASNDPVITRRYSNATIDVAEVETPSSGIP